MYTWTCIIVLVIYGKHKFKTYYIHIIKISTNKRANSYELRIEQN